MFMKLLAKCSTDDNTNEETFSPLRHVSIIAMSNLLSANIENGMSHAMSKSLPSDYQLHAVCCALPGGNMEVLIKGVSCVKYDALKCVDPVLLMTVMKHTNCLR